MSLSLLMGMILLSAGSASAAPIAGGDILLIPQGVQGSGNGTLDLRLLTFSGSEVDNASGGFNGDNANGSIPNGGGEDTGSFAASYVTTAGDLQSYYALNFGATTTGQIELVIFLDMNETGGGEPNNTLALFDIVLNPTTIAGNPDPIGDVLGAAQAAINQSYTGGTTVAYLDPQPAGNLPVNAQGAGFADYAIYTGLDPFALNFSDVLLFNISMDALSNGSEELFLSGSFSGEDVQTASAPEPGTALLVALGLVLLGTKTRR